MGLRKKGEKWIKLVQFVTQFRDFLITAQIPTIRGISEQGGRLSDYQDEPRCVEMTEMQAVMKWNKEQSGKLSFLSWSGNVHCQA